MLLEHTDLCFCVARWLVVQVPCWVPDSCPTKAEVELGGMGEAAIGVGVGLCGWCFMAGHWWGDVSWWLVWSAEVIEGLSGIQVLQSMFSEAGLQLPMVIPYCFAVSSGVAVALCLDHDRHFLFGLLPRESLGELVAELVHSQKK